MSGVAFLTGLRIGDSRGYSDGYNEGYLYDCKDEYEKMYARVREQEEVIKKVTRNMELVKEYGEKLQSAQAYRDTLENRKRRGALMRSEPFEAETRNVFFMKLK